MKKLLLGALAVAAVTVTEAKALAPSFVWVCTIDANIERESKQGLQTPVLDITTTGDSVATGLMSCTDQFGRHQGGPVGVVVHSAGLSVQVLPGPSSSKITAISLKAGAA